MILDIVHLQPEINRPVFIQFLLETGREAISVYKTVCSGEGVFVFSYVQYAGHIEICPECNGRFGESMTEMKWMVAAPIRLR